MNPIEKYTKFIREDINNVSGVYIIRNKINNKKYIGCTRNIHTRLCGHINKLVKQNHRNYYLQKAVIKYGIENFEFDVVELCEVDELYKREHHWATILYVHDRKLGYNIQPTNPDGEVIISEETRKKISIGAIGRKVSTHQLEILRNTNKGKKFTEEHRRKISESNKGKKMSLEAIEKTRKVNTGRKRDSEIDNKRINTRKRIAQERGYYYTEEQKKRFSEGIYNSPKNVAKRLRRQEKQNEINLKKPIVAINILTGEVSEYKSALEASPILNINNKLICSYIHDNKGLEKDFLSCKNYIFIKKMNYDPTRKYNCRKSKIV